MGWLQANEGSRVLLVSACMWRQKERYKGDGLGLSRKKGILQPERWHKYEVVCQMEKSESSVLLRM